MKIIWIAHESSLSGANKCLITAIKGLSENNIQSIVIVPCHGPLVDYLSTLNIRIIYHKYYWWTYGGLNNIFKFNNIRNLFRNLLAAWDIHKSLKNIKPNLVITNTSTIPSGAIAAYFLKIKHIWYIHEYGKEDHQFEFLWSNKLSYKLISFLSVKVIAVSKNLASNLQCKGIKPSKITTLHNSINVSEKINSIPAAKKDGKFTLLSLGRIAKGKRIEVVIKAMGQLSNKGIKNIHLKIIGGQSDRDYVNYLKSIIKELNINDLISFHGYIDNPEKEIKQSNAMIIASQSEAFGLVVIESMAQHTLVIASNTGALTELIKEKETGLLFNTNSHLELADKIEYAIKHPSIISKIENCAYRYYKEQFTPETYIANLQRILIEATN